MLSFFPRGVLDEILNLIESVSEGFPSYSFILLWDIIPCRTTKLAKKPVLIYGWCMIHSQFTRQ